MGWSSKYVNTTQCFFPCMHRLQILKLWYMNSRWKTTKLIFKKAAKFSRWWFQRSFIFTPKMRKSSKLTNIFQLGWNHQPVLFVVQVMFFTFIKPSCLLWQPKMDLSPFFGKKWKCIFPSQRTSKSKQIPAVSTNTCNVINQSHEVWFLHSM